MASLSIVGSGDASLRLSRETILKRRLEGSKEVEDKITVTFCKILRQEEVGPETYKEMLQLMRPKSRRTFFQIEATEEEEQQIKKLFIDNFKESVPEDLLAKVEKEITYGIDVERKLVKIEQAFAAREAEEKSKKNDVSPAAQDIQPPCISPRKTAEEKKESVWSVMKNIFLDILFYIPVVNVFFPYSYKK